MFWSVRIHLRGLVGQHDPRVSDLDLSVSDPVSHGHTKEFLRAECLLVEMNRGVGILENEIRSDRGIAFGNWLDHFKAPSWTKVQSEKYRPSRPPSLICAHGPGHKSTAAPLVTKEGV